MTERGASKLDFRRKPLLITAGLVAVAMPVLFALLRGTQTRAESKLRTQLLCLGTRSLRSNQTKLAVIRTG